MSRQQAVLDELEGVRAQFHQQVDSHIDALILRTTVGNLAAYLQGTGAHVLPLSSAAAQCKEAEPVAVVLPDGGKVETATWIEAAAAILKDCDADPQRHAQLMELCGQVPGNARQLLSGTPDGMVSPLKINEGLYLEGKFDTQALLDDLTQKILRQVGYDCGGVAVLYRVPRQEPAMTELEEGPVLPTGPMM